MPPVASISNSAAEADISLVAMALSDRSLNPQPPPVSTRSHSARELMPAVWRLEDILLHRDSESVSIILGRRDRRLVLAAILDPGL